MSPTAARDAGRRRRTVSITTVLAAGFGALLLVGMGAVQGISLWTARENTLSLLATNGRFAVQALGAGVKRHLEPVEEIASYVVRLIDSGQLDVEDRERMEEALLTAAAGTRQVFGMAFVYPDGRFLRVRRGRGAYAEPEGARRAGVPETAERTEDPASGGGARLLEAAQRESSSKAVWVGPVRVPEIRRTLLLVRATVRKGDEFQGVLLSTVSPEQLSREIARSDGLARAGKRFVLYGRGHVLAHRHMTEGGYRTNPDVALPTLGQVDDPVLARLRDENGREEMAAEFGGAVEGHVTTVDGERHVFLYSALEGVGQLPLTVGVHIGPEDGLGSEFRRLVHAGVAGSAVIVLCVLAAAVVGRRVGAPVRALAAGSRAIADLDFDRAGRLRASRLRELDEAAGAFNRMTTGLRWFQTYVPRRLVRRLVEQGAPVASEERPVTVMFTDLAGFSTLSERLSASDVVDLLNAHFSLVVACIEAENGVVDKYIGDSVMAFWEDDDGADRAIRAARAIRAGMNAGGGTGAAAEPMRMRIGIHRGRAIVGNIGPEGRVNYTVVGDTVNVAARLEELCKEAAERAGTAVLGAERRSRRPSTATAWFRGGVFQCAGATAASRPTN